MKTNAGKCNLLTSSNKELSIALTITLKTVNVRNLLVEKLTKAKL